MSCYNFSISQGTDVLVPILLTDATDHPLDLNGFSARMQLRKSLYAEDAEDTLTSENGRIEIVPDEGKLTLKFGHDTTEAYPAQVLVYDIELVSGSGLVTRILSGRIRVTPEVTKVE